MANKPKKYVVIYESDTGYMDCIAICDNADEAYGKAYLQLCDGFSDDEAREYYLTMPEYREGENGMIIELKEKETDKLDAWCTVLFYDYGEDEKHGQM